jgi:hypothetical protein
MSHSSTGGNGSPSASHRTANRPRFIMDDVRLLFAQLSSPETQVTFNPAERANPSTIETTIHPPQATWNWPDQTARLAQQVTGADLGKYGLQQDSGTLYRLVNLSPLQWEPVRDFTNATWTWRNVTARENEPVTAEDIGKTGFQADTDTYYLLTGTEPAVWQPVPNPYSTSSPFELSTGAADADAYHDFFRLQIAFEDVWAELLDQKIGSIGQQLYTQWDALMDQSTDYLNDTDRQKIFDSAPAGNITGVDELQKFLDNLKILLGISTPPGPIQINSGGGSGNSSPPVIIAPPATASNITFPDLSNLLTELDGLLKEKYRFDVFAPASINYGLLLNYRQHWQPQSYQVGNLVSTIPLAPQETRRYTTKTVVKQTRNVKEISDSLRSGKDESTDTWRVDAEIVDRAKNQTSFQTNASGSYGNDNLYKVSAGMQQGRDQAVESAQTKREFHESVVKSAQEYRNEHRLEISTEETSEDETTSFREIRNPNDELTVTYLFYELQRRYLVDESLFKATPVVLVANEVPAPHQVDQGWILRHDWILKRTILDDSYLPALEYLATDYTGAELTLQTLSLAVEQQKTIVDRISRQVQVANQSLDTATLGLQAAESQEVQDQQQNETAALVKSIFDPLNISQAGNPGDGNSDRARVDFAKDALNRAQAKVNQLVSDLNQETTALQLAIDKYTAATTKHFSMLAEIDRLRIHLKDNIIYYMQAIWAYEPADQRYFRLYNLDVPTFGHNTAVTFTESDGLAKLDPSNRSIEIAFPSPTLLDQPAKLHQVADLETLLGFKGNYMIFPVTDFDNYLIWYMMQNFINVDPINGVTVADPDPGADFTLEQLQAAKEQIQPGDWDSFAKNEAAFEEIMFRLLSRQNPEMVIVPSDSLYIEALPGTHSLLEDFKLIHRAIDVKRAQADARRAELENLRLGARLATDELSDPDIDKVVLVKNGQPITVDTGNTP